MAAAVALQAQGGADWWAQFVYTDGTGNPVAVTSPKMEVRSGQNSTAAVLYTSEGGTPTITITQPQSNTVLVAIAGSVTKGAATPLMGYWDCYAVDPNGKTVLLGSGTFVLSPNVTAL